MERRAKLASTVLAALAVAGVVSFYVYDVVLTRPKIQPYRATPLDLVALDGSRLSLAALRGQVVFVNFWATWCPPCREEMPSMVRLGQELARRHPGKFAMVAVSVDDGWAPVREYFAAPPFFGAPSSLSVVLDDRQA